MATAAEVAASASGFKVERLVVAFECGAIVNPDGLHNQVEGAVVQGLGGALFEAIEFADGAAAERHDGAVSRAALQGRPADRGRAARSQGSSVGRRRRDADRLRGAGDRLGGAGLWRRCDTDACEACVT